ncbi:hypothetical protein [Accumulibacter sp.]|uniref:hypothetical protein n=1 Tax=Accumulibacter sp. TaxID=2053492 RepID=UPI0035AF77A8
MEDIMEGLGRVRPTARVASIIIGAAALASCVTPPYSETPLATNFPTSEQPKLQAAAHWTSVADGAAEALVASLGLGASCAAAPAPCPPVFVRPPAQQTAFAKGFHSALITALLRQKAAVSHAPAGAISLDIDIQTVRFSPNRRDGRFLPLSIPYAGGWAVYGLAKHAAPAVAGAAGAVVIGGLDIYRWNISDWASGPTPQTEVIVTVSASDATRYLGRVSNVYYVADGDASLYVGPPQLYSVPVGGDR